MSMKKPLVVIIIGILSIVTIIIIGGYFLEKTPSNIVNQLEFQEICDPDLSLFRSTDFLTEDQSIELVGIYDSSSLEIKNYDPHPCLEWIGTNQCRIIYWQEEIKIIDGKEYNTPSMKSTSCPDNVKRVFPNSGNYKVKKTCCVNNGDCSLLDSYPYPMEEGCSVVVEGPKLEKACYLRPIELSGSLKDIEDNDYVSIKGRLSPFFRTHPIELEKQNEEHFIMKVDSYKKLKPFVVDSERSMAICSENLLQNNDLIQKYCSENGFSCEVNQSLKKISQFPKERLTRFSAEEKWVIKIPVGVKDIIEQDLRLELNVVCQINPYLGNLIESTVCSEESCIRCEL